MLNSTKTVIAALILTLVAGTAAASPANIDLFPSQSSTRIDHFTEFEVTVENTGPVKDNYELTSSSPSEIRIAPNEVTLNPGNQETANLWYNPLIDKDEGTYSFTVTATSQASGQKYSDNAKVSVIKEHKVDVAVDSRSKTGCLGEQVEYRLQVTNTGIQQEGFDLRTDRGSLSVNSLNLEDGETQNVTLVISSDSPVERNFNVVASSKESYANDIQNIDFTAERCWASDVSVTPQSQETAAKTEAEFEVTVRNTGTKADSFVLSTNKGELGDTELQINSKSSATTTLSLTPQETGETQLKVTADSEVTGTATASLTSFNGMDMEVSTARNNINVCENEDVEVEATIENTGAAEETYSLSSSDGVLEEEKVTLKPGKDEEVEIDLNTSERKAGAYPVEVIARAESFGQPEKTAASNVKVNNCWDLDMSVLRSVASAGENRSVIYEVQLHNNGTEENTYELSHEGPSWVSVKPEEVTVASSETKTAFIYAGIPYQKEGEVTITATAEGKEVVRSQDVKLLIGEEVEEAIRDDKGGGLIGSFTKSFSGAFEEVTKPDASKLLLSIVVGLGITALVLLREW